MPQQKRDYEVLGSGRDGKELKGKTKHNTKGGWKQEKKERKPAIEPA